MKTGKDFVPFSLLLQSGEGKAQTIYPLLQSRRKAEEILQEADKVLAEARRQASEIERAAYEKGYAEGRDRGEAEGKARYEESVSRLTRMTDSVEQQRNLIQKQYEKELLPVVLAVVDRLVHHEISVNQRVIFGCLCKALQFVADSAVVKVHLHPDDFAKIREASLTNTDLLAGRKQLDFIEDESVSMGGCLLRSDFGEVDASLDQFRSRLYKAVEEAFLSALAESG